MILECVEIKKDIYKVMQFLLTISIALLGIYLFLVYWRKWLLAKENKKFHEAMQKRQEEIAQDTNRMTSDHIRDVLITLNLPLLILNLFDKTDDLTKYGFYDCFRPASDLVDSMTQKEQEIVFEHKRYYPLFETMDDSLEFLVYDQQLDGFLRFYPDKSVSLREYELLTWEGTFLYTVLTWYEDEHTEDEILAMCQRFGLKYDPIILEEIRKVVYETRFESFGDWKKGMIHKMGALIKEGINE